MKQKPWIKLQQHQSGARAIGASLLLILLVTLLAKIFDTALTLAGHSMLYLVGVVLAATYLGRNGGVLTAVLSVLALNFFFTPPYHTLRVANPDNVVELAALLGVSLYISQLVHRLRTEIHTSRRREHRLGMLYQLSQRLEATDTEATIRLGLRYLHEAMGCPCALFLPQDAQHLRCAGAEPEATPPAYDPRAIQWVIDHDKPLGPLTRNWPELDYWAIPLPGGGALALSVCPSFPPQKLDLKDLESFAHLIGLALGREKAQDAARQEHLRAETEALRNTLLASLSHDVRTPLAVIIGAAGALRDQAATLSPAQRDGLLTTVEDEAEQMSRTAENVLQLARVSASGFAPRLDWESMEELLGAVVARQRKRAPLARIHLHLARDLPLARVDAGLVSQACTNLLENALKHASPGPVDVTAEVEGSHLLLSVKDLGPGFPLSGQLRGAASEQRSGGLGLQVCEAVARVHGGRLERLNRPNGGGEVRLYLPLGTPPAAAPEATP
jgi:two-component system, OmpR family, sensor histidine kinase KdpD